MSRARNCAGFALGSATLSSDVNLGGGVWLLANSKALATVATKLRGTNVPVWSCSYRHLNPSLIHIL